MIAGRMVGSGGQLCVTLLQQTTASKSIEGYKLMRSFELCLDEVTSEVTAPPAAVEFSS
jgi:hypothetical protein